MDRHGVKPQTTGLWSEICVDAVSNRALFILNKLDCVSIEKKKTFTDTYTRCLNPIIKSCFMSDYFPAQTVKRWIGIGAFSSNWMFHIFPSRRHAFAVGIYRARENKNSSWPTDLWPPTPRAENGSQAESPVEWWQLVSRLHWNYLDSLESPPTGS